MTYYTIDQIVSGLLLKQGKPKHWYLQYLKYALDGLRELHFDTLGNISTQKLSVSSYKAVILPCDYVDWVRVGVQVNDKVKPLAQDNGLNRLNNYDSTGEKVPYETADTTPNSNGWYYDFILKRNSYNEFLGGIFNNRPDMAGYKFKVLKERNEIQFPLDFPYDEIILEYINDGITNDAATKVDPYATDALESYVMWQKALHDVNGNSGSIMMRKDVFDRAYRILRARKQGLSKDDIINSVRKGYSATYKN